MVSLKAVFTKNQLTWTLSLTPTWNELSNEDRAAWDALAPQILTPAVRQYDRVDVDVTPEVACVACKEGNTTLVSISGMIRHRLLPIVAACTKCLSHELAAAPLR